MVSLSSWLRLLAIRNRRGHTKSSSTIWRCFSIPEIFIYGILEPYVAIVVDPVRTKSTGKVNIGAFRTFPKGYLPSHEEAAEYQSIPIEKIEDFGVHANQYYQLDIEVFTVRMDHRWRILSSNFRHKRIKICSSRFGISTGHQRFQCLLFMSKNWLTCLREKNLSNRKYLTNSINDVGAKIELIAEKVKIWITCWNLKSEIRSVSKVTAAQPEWIQLLEWTN